MNKACCDFCMSLMPLWSVYCSKEIVRRIDDKNLYVMSKDWGACNKCIEFIKNKDIDGLLKVTYRNRVDNKVAASIWEELFANIESIKEDNLKALL